MLRGRTDQVRVGPTPQASVERLPDVGFPSADQAYATGERSAGILFYQAKESFWLPYHLLQTMHCQAERLKLVFATDEVVVSGRGLHELYLQLARQTVGRIVEQGERFAAVSEAPLFVSRIERTPVQRAA